MGGVGTFVGEKVDISFRFGADQADKMRACDDLRSSHVNLRCTVWAPAELPTWDRISQMFLDIKTSDRKWAFFMLGHEEAYK